MRENHSVSGAKPPQGRSFARVGDAKMDGFIHIPPKGGRGLFAPHRRQTGLVQITAPHRLFLSGKQTGSRHARNMNVNTAKAHG